MINFLKSWSDAVEPVRAFCFFFPSGAPDRFDGVVSAKRSMFSSSVAAFLCFFGGAGAVVTPDAAAEAADDAGPRALVGLLPRRPDRSRSGFSAAAVFALLLRSHAGTTSSVAIASMCCCVNGGGPPDVVRGKMQLQRLKSRANKCAVLCLFF